MYGEIKFMSGIDPVGVKERELAIAEKRSHSAKIAHKRRKAKREAQSPSEPPGKSRLAVSNSTLRRRNDDAGKPLHLVELSPESQWSTPYGTWSPVHESSSEASESSAFKTSKSTIVPYTKLSTTPSVPAQPHSNVFLAFDNAYGLQAFDFWLRISGPATARYASPYGDVWTRVLPQFAMTSTTVRHMLLAHAYIFAKYFRAFSADAHKLEKLALYHYSQGVKEMCTKVSGNEFLAAAKLGYVFEALTHNNDRALLHLKGSDAIVRNYDGYKDDTFQLLVGSHEVANKITSILTHKTVQACQEDSPRAIPWNCAPFDTTGEARRMIGLTIERIGDSSSRDGDTALDDIKVSLRDWSGTLRKWDAQDAPSPHRTALLLLFNLATALLPTNDVKRLNQAASPHLIQYILKSANEYLDNLRKMSVENQKDLVMTLRMLASYIIRFVQLSEYQERSRSLLDRIKSSSP